MTCGPRHVPGVTVSVVSHGHGPDVLALLQQLARLRPPALRRVLLTFNIREAATQTAIDAGNWPFEVNVHANAHPAGFGSNHNRAFERDRRAGPSATFVVLNPDIHMTADALGACHDELGRTARAGCAYPRLVDAIGAPQDQARRVPTPARLMARYLAGRRHECTDQEPPDWVSGAFLALRHEAYAQIGGFDEGYRMYCEDVDLCLRLRLAGWSLVPVAVQVAHQAHRASHRHWRHLYWHLGSLIRLWRSSTYVHYRQGAR